MILSTTDTSTAIFGTEHTHMYQCDVTETFQLQFFGQQIEFRTCELIIFRRKIQQVDILDLLDSDTPDTELIQLPHCNRFFLFSTLEILELKELMSGVFTMLELNSLIHQRIVRKWV